MNESFRYAGIGSRETPKYLRSLIMDISSYLSTVGGILVSGGARGADTFFEQGADRLGGKKEIWIPEEGFNGRTSDLLPSSDAFIVAKRYVDHWSSCNSWSRSAHARNCHQILGADLVSPVKFVIAWTDRGDLVGGTATALKIAMDYEIPIMNLGSKEWTVEEIDEWLNLYLST